LKTVTVTSSDSQHYTIDFNDNNSATNLNINQLTVTDANWDTGFLPAAQVTTVSKPIVISGIKVSPTNATLTAASIVDAFNQFSQTYYTASNNGISTVTMTIPTVSVTSVPTAADPNGLRTFNIEFIGDTSCTVVPLVTVMAWDETVTSYTPANAISTPTTVSLVKENSAIFRVNPAELDNPFTQKLDLFDQSAPSVAMDAAGRTS